MTDYEVFELPHKLELISEEQRPSLYSLSSFTNSICSDSTIDLDELDHIDSTIHDSNGLTKSGSKPLHNNFLSEELSEPTYSERKGETITQEPLIKAIKQSHPSFSKSVSLHDVSNILPLNLTAKSNTVSCETVNSHSLSSTTKSKDSGFQRSLSCLSLTSGKRNYDHVQSKVKAYIKNIKDSEALNKKNKLLKNKEESCEQIILVNESVDVVEKDDLIKEIQELKHELHEKSLYIDAQQRNYNKLLLKFAETKNIVDKLRLQSFSFNFSTDNESQDQTASIGQENSDTFYCKLRRNFNQISSCIAEDPAEKDSSPSAEITNKVVPENFKPCNHSSPYEKSLSPVRKMFSSSSRLDKNYQPLTNPRRSNIQLCKLQAQNSHRAQALVGSYDIAVKNGCFKLNNHSNLLRRQSMSIDLPNDDPFDKVKKWQESLPNINLLGTHSSSDCEEKDHDPAHIQSPPHFNSKKSDSNLLKCPLTKNAPNESEICNILSQDLQNKCIITEMEVYTEQQVVSRKNNQDITKTSTKKEKKVNTYSTSYSISEEVKPLFVNNNCMASNKRCLLHSKHHNKINKPLNCLMRGNSVDIIFPTLELETKKTDYVPLCSRESSISEDDSTHLPKSSSISNHRSKKAENDENSDDSSSISSSVLGSDSPLTEPSKRAKRRLGLCEETFSNKVPKMTKSKSSQTTFKLREPKLNFVIPVENNGSLISKQTSPETNFTNYETWFKYRSSSNTTVNCSIKPESSQRKAWNTRNNVNFFVCKDFTFNKSASLMECIEDMEGLVSEGSLVIRSVVTRNNSTC